MFYLSEGSRFNYLKRTRSDDRCQDQGRHVRACSSDLFSGNELSLLIEAKQIVVSIFKGLVIL